jgi:hypothetical protein
MRNPELKHKADERLQAIANIIQLSAENTTSPGLLNGNMGSVIFFYNYYRYCGKDYYNSLAGDLLDSTIENINSDEPLNLSTGLLGFGWGIEYLVKEKFVEGDPDEILNDMEKLILSREDVLLPDKQDQTWFDIVHYTIARNSRSEESLKAKLYSGILKAIDKINKEAFNHYSFSDTSAILYFLTRIPRSASQNPSSMMLIENIIKLNNTRNIDFTQMALQDGLVQMLNRIEKKPETHISVQSDDEIIHQAIRLNCNKLLYNDIIQDSGILIRKAEEILLQTDKYWECLLDRMKQIDLSLGRGLAGLGLLLIDKYLVSHK